MSDRVRYVIQMHDDRGVVGDGEFVAPRGTTEARARQAHRESVEHCRQNTPVPGALVLYVRVPGRADVELAREHISVIQ